MDDQVGVGVADRVADLLEHLQPRFQRDPVVAAVIGDRYAVDVLQCQVWQPVGAEAGIEQAGDVRVGEAGEDLPLAGEAQPQVGVGQARPQQLQRDPSLVQAVGARGQPDLAHATFAEHVF